MSEQIIDNRLRCKLNAEVRFSVFQMEYDMGLGGYWLAANCYAVFSLVLSMSLCIVSAYLCTYVPLYIMYD